MAKLTQAEAIVAYAQAKILKYKESSDEAKGLWIANFELEGASYSVRLDQTVIPMDSTPGFVKGKLISDFVTNVDKLPPAIPKYEVLEEPKV